MAGPAFLKGNFTDLYGSAMLPALELIFRHELPMFVGIRDELFNKKTTNLDIWQMTSTHDIDLFNAMNEGQDYTFVSPRQGSNMTLSIQKYGLGVSISEEAVADGKFDELADLLKKLARSAAESREVLAANIFNNAWSSQKTPDGVSVFNSAHTLPSGATFSNVMTVNADLSESGLQTARWSFYTQFVGDTGIIYRVEPKVLLVHPKFQAYAEELVGSDHKPDSADNNLNSLKRWGLRVVTNPHLTDTDDWYLLGAPMDTGLVIVEREGIVTKAGGPDVGFINDSILYKSRFREQIGVIHPYGMIGNQGST